MKWLLGSVVAGLLWLMMVVVVVNVVGCIIFFGLMGTGETPNPAGNMPVYAPGYPPQSAPARSSPPKGPQKTAPPGQNAMR